MDAQNAAQSDQTRPVGASPQLPARPPDAASSPVTVNSKPAEPVKDSRPPVVASPAIALDAPEDRSSDAETIVLPGKDGHSPSKVRKVRQEDRSDGDPDAAKPPKASSSLDTNKPTLPNRLVDSVKRKRLSSHLDRDRLPRNKEISSGLSSAPTSPPRLPKFRRRSDDHGSSSESDHSHPRPPRATLRDKLKSGERLVPNKYKRKVPKHDSDDEGETRKARRQRTASSTTDSRLQREPRALPSKPNHDARSISPQARAHRRSISSQLPSYSNGLSQKKKRLPAPLQAPDYHSDESSASGSPHPRSSKLRGLAGHAAESNASPAKMAPHKKHLDAHGQTFLARACARGEYDGAKQRLGERPEDLNVADYAGNTPLQIAAINGCEDIVKLLIDAGCNLDCVNYDKDTPLLDAVDNGHLGVVKLLLDAGVNPRKANVNGEEPVDRVNDDTDNADEIRACLIEAKKRFGGRQRTSEDRHSHHDSHDTRDSHAPDSPRRSPATLAGHTARRPGTVRATKTRNDLLYMPLDEKTLRQAAGRGDEETVARILQVKEGVDDPESMVAAARGGHDLVIQLLLGLGGANPDPAPVKYMQPDVATPILAAIGQENIKVVELLLEQQGFDPTRRFKGETYYEVARRRQGTNWKEEEQKLKNAYDEYKRGHKDTSVKTKSPRRERERDREDREAKRARRVEAREKEEARMLKRSLSSPARDIEPKKKVTPAKLPSPKERRKSDAPLNRDEAPSKRGPGRPKKEDRLLSSIHVSDLDTSPTIPTKVKPKRIEIDLVGGSSEGETVKPRRKLVSKGELRGERERKRRASMASNASSLKDHPTSPHDTKHEEPEKHRSDKLSEKYHDRTKALKRDDSKDRHLVPGEGSSKRHRKSTTPDGLGNGDKDDGEIVPKRRRLDGEAKEKRPKRSLSDERSRKSNTQDIKPPKSDQKHHDDERREGRRGLHRGDSTRSSSSEKQINVKYEEVDVEMKDAVPTKAEEAEAKAAREKEAELEKQRQEEEARKRKKKEQEEEEQRKRLEAEEKKKREEEVRKKLEEEEKKRKEEEAEKRRREEEEREAERKKEEEERKQKEAEEKLRREAEEKARHEEENKKRKLEEEKKKKEEEERRQREEEEKLRREQLEREAAEEAQRQREEEERKERERVQREEMERKRVLHEAEQRRIREEQEKQRVARLPPLLRWLDACANPKLPSIAERFKRLQGVRYDTLRPEANQTTEGREQWVLNTHVALLLGEKDLTLPRCR